MSREYVNIDMYITSVISTIALIKIAVDTQAKSPYKFINNRHNIKQYGYWTYIW